MGIEGFDGQEPVVESAVPIQEIQAVIEGLMHGKILRGMKDFPVVHIEPAAFSAHFPHPSLQVFGAELVGRQLCGRRGKISHISVMGLTANAHPGGIAAVIGAAPVLHVMVMIGAQMGIE